MSPALNDLVIRSATPADEARIASLWARLMAEMHRLDSRQPRPLVGADRQYAARVIRTLGDPKMRVLIAEQQASVIGFALGAVIDQQSDLFVPETSGFIADLYVQPESRRCGVGRALVVSLKEWLTANRVRYILLNVDSANTEGRAFWQSMGGVDFQSRIRIENNIQN